MMKNKLLLLFLVAMSIFAIYSCKETQMTTKNDNGPALDLSNMDTSVRPGDDFYRYVNGAWMDKIEIPADRGRWGSFDELRKRTSESVLNIFDKAISDPNYAKGSDQKKAVVYYKTAMDTQRLDKVGVGPLEPYLAAIDRIKDVSSLQSYIEEMTPLGMNGFLGFSVFTDLENSKQHAPYLSEGEIGLPDRDYYTKDDQDSKELRDKYEKHIAKMFSFIGKDASSAHLAAQKVLGFETSMAEVMMTKEESRNPMNIYNKRSIKDLKIICPSFNWNQYFKSTKVKPFDSLIVTNPKFLPLFENTLKAGNIETWKNYLQWIVINNGANFLSRDVEQANFDFYGKEMRGTKEMTPRWERVLNNENATMGEAIGKLYVDEYFPPEAKAKAADMVSNVIEAFGNRIKALDWMSDTTKTKSIEKLSKINIKIGYPNKWKDYSTLEIKSFTNGGSYFYNAMNARKWNFEDSMKKLGEEVDKSEWGMAPQVVNAYYNPLNNEIVFPAAILQPPFYNYKADDAINFGGIGAVIGHEISHGFDDQGSRFDSDGNMKNWWTDTDNKKFKERNKALIDQFNAYEPLPGVFVNGEFTLGENIGDLGGINVAYDGLQLHFKKHGRTADIDSLTAEQRFFMSWATIWRGKIRDEALKTQINTDPHSPTQYRAIGPLTNLETFHQAFDIKKGDKLYKEPNDRVKIW